MLLLIVEGKESGSYAQGDFEHEEMDPPSGRETGNTSRFSPRSLRPFRKSELGKTRS